jgi:hypothetical protein
MNTPGDVEVRREKRLDLVRVDYDKTLSWIEALARSSQTLRGVALTIDAAVLTFAVQQSNVAIAVVGLILIPTFLLTDCYYQWHYLKGLGRAHEIEGILALRFKELERGDDDARTRRKLDTALAQHRVGQYTNVPRFQFSYLGKVLPKGVALAFWTTLAALAVAAIVYCAID